MRVYQKFLMIFGLTALLVAPESYAQGAADKVPEQKAMQELTSKVAPAPAPAPQDNSSYACPLGSGGGAAAVAQNLGSINAMLSPENIRNITKKWRVSTKNLPPGNYRERCFGCLTMPDEDGERKLSCVCPGDENMERVEVSLQNCKEGEEITLCGGMLVCGKCLYTEGAIPQADTKSPKTDKNTEAILSIIGRKPLKQ